MFERKCDRSRAIQGVIHMVGFDCSNCRDGSFLLGWDSDSLCALLVLTEAPRHGG